MTDVFTGLYAATAVLACLHARAQSGHGYAIDLALLDCAVAAQVNLVQAFLTSGEVPARQGNAHLQIVPYQAFATADDWLVLAIGNDGQWQRYCAAAEHPDWATDSRFTTNVLRVQHRAALVPLLEADFRRRNSGEWQRRLTDAEVPHAPVLDYRQLFALEQATARGLKITVRDPAGQPIDLVGSPFHIAGAPLPEPACPPHLGQQTDALLQDVLGLSAEEIDLLRKGDVV